MVFVTLLLSFIRQRVGWRNGLGIYCLLRARMLSCYFPVICLMQLKTLKNGKCVLQTWERSAECDISVAQCRMLRTVCGRKEFCSSSIRIPKLCFSTYGSFNVLLQSALHPGFSSVQQYSAHAALTDFIRLSYRAVSMFSSSVSPRKPKAISHGQILDCCSELNYLPYIPTICKVSKASQSKSACNTAQWFSPY